MTLNVRLMAVPGPNNPVAPGTILTVDSVTARTMPNYFQIEITGTTAQRPKAGDPGVPNLAAGTAYYDTTLAKTIYFDGISWRDPASGAVV
jgi:hypothetical protein